MSVLTVVFLFEQTVVLLKEEDVQPVGGAVTHHLENTPYLIVHVGTSVLIFRLEPKRSRPRGECRVCSSSVWELYF